MEKGAVVVWTLVGTRFRHTYWYEVRPVGTMEVEIAADVDEVFGV
jgi:hypothetical protein